MEQQPYILLMNFEKAIWLISSILMGLDEEYGNWLIDYFIDCMQKSIGREEGTFRKWPDQEDGSTEPFLAT